MSNVGTWRRAEQEEASVLVLDRDAIADLCRRFGVRRLAVFGSALTDRFDEARSDVDFLVEFSDDSSSRFDAYFGLKEELESLLGRPVDLVSPSALENPFFAASVEAEAQELYAA
jgi:predicted nucleotidyltransferase